MEESIKTVREMKKKGLLYAYLNKVGYGSKIGFI